MRTTGLSQSLGPPVISAAGSGVAHIRGAARGRRDPVATHLDGACKFESQYRTVDRATEMSLAQARHPTTVSCQAATSVCVGQATCSL